MHYPVCSIGNVSVIKKVISDFYSARQCTSSHYEFCSFDLGKTRSYWEKSLQTIDNSDNFPGGRIFKIFSQQYCHKFRFEMSNILNILTSTTSVARTFSTNCYSPFKERYLCYFSSSDAHWQTLYRFRSSSQSPVFALKRFIDQSKVTCFRETRKINNNNNVSNGPFQLRYHSYPIFFEWNKLIKKKKLHFWGTRVHVYTLVTKNFPPTYNFRGSQWAGQCNFGREISC